MENFNKEDLEFYLGYGLPFKGLDKKYIMDCIFNKKIQKKWKPEVGDIIVGCTGNIFVISNKFDFHESLGGTEYYFGGATCVRDGGNVMNETYCSTMNESGIKYGYTKNGIQPIEDCYHSSWKDFRFVPYPHEKHRM